MTTINKPDHNYKKPSMVKLGGPLYAKHGAVTNNTLPVRTHIDQSSVDELVSQYGSPLFVFSETSIRKIYRRYAHAFQSRYPNVIFGWSYKTNYLKAVCSVIHSEGAIAEVVSNFEYEKARAMGIDGEDIIYNGPFKTKDSLVRAVKEGARIHLDGLDEIGTLEAISAELKMKARIGIRVNMNTGTYPQWSRFGFNLESGQALDAAVRVSKSEAFRFEGLHCHIGTFMLSPEAYGLAAEKMAKLFLEIEKKTAVRLQYIDVGGGFPSKSHLKGVYDAPEVSVPDIEVYAEVITSGLKTHLGELHLPTLIVESGRHVIDEAGFLITSVVARKLLPDARRAYVLDAGVNLLYTSTWYRFKIELDGEEKGFVEPAILFGPLCMNIDVVDDSLMLPPLKLGKHLVLSPVGAYNATQWMQFIQYRPAVVLIRESGAVNLIRRRENLDSLEALEILPEDFKEQRPDPSLYIVKPAS